MTRTAKLLAGAAFAAFAGTALPTQAATIIQDGNFDVPPAVNPFAEYFSGAVFGGLTNNVWSVSGNSIDLVGNYWVAPTAGGGSVDLNGGDAGGLSQAFTLGSGGTYQLSFYLSGNPDGGDPLKSLAVSVGDVSSQIYTFTTGANSRGDMQYILETLTFHADAGANVLSFLSQNTNSPFGAVIGGISIASVPEPATWMMLILGFGLTGSLLRKNRGTGLIAA